MVTVFNLDSFSAEDNNTLRSHFAQNNHFRSIYNITTLCVKI